jgi:hypothetical protein
MIIENNLLAVSKVMFQNRENWKHVTDTQKETFFFIFNRYFSKKYPEMASFLNDKNINKAEGLDLWYHYMKNKPYPKWFWGKVEKKKDDSEFSEKDIEKLLFRFDIKKSELDLLIKYNISEVKEELKYIKSTEK